MTEHVEDESNEIPVRRIRNFATLRGIVIGAAVVVLALGVVLAGRLAARPQATSLLPPSIIAQIKSFTPYFYTDAVPAGYSMKTTQISFERDVLIVPLNSPNGPPLVLSEQAMPGNLTPEAVQQNGSPVSTSVGKATINDIEGRLVGTLIPTDKRTLILISGAEKADKNALTSLLQQLKPVR